MIDGRERARVAVIIPCYNTSSSCSPVLAAALAQADAVLAIDDGSTDDTLAHIQASGCSYIRLPVNQGKGVALRMGFEEVVKGSVGILKREFDYVVTLDGDGQHDPVEIPRFLEAAVREHSDLVLGLRNVRLMPPKSKIGNYASRILFFLGTGHYVPDTQSGYRLFTVALARTLLGEVAWRRYETEAEILSKTVSLGFRVTTVEIPTIYFDRNRRTHFDPLWDSMRVIAVLARYALSSLAVTAVDVSTFVALVSAAQLGTVTANVGARMVAVAAHFLLAREYAFRVQGRFQSVELVRYGLAVSANLAFTTWLILFLERMGADVLVGKLIAQLAGFGLTFIVLDKFVFRRSASGRTDWDRYYSRPVTTAKWSRRVMENELVRVVTEYAPSRARLAVLEVGGGNSCFLPRLMREFGFNRYALLDSSPEGIRLAKERFLPIFGPQVECIEGDAFHVALECKYDLVFSVGLLEHFEERDARRLIDLHRDWAVDDGLIVITVPTPTPLYRFTRTIAELLGIWHFPDEQPIPRRDLVQLIREAGLEVLSERTLWAQVLTQSVVAARRPRSGIDSSTDPAVGVRTGRLYSA